MDRGKRPTERGSSEEPPRGRRRIPGVISSVPAPRRLPAAGDAAGPAGGAGAGARPESADELRARLHTVIVALTRAEEEAEDARANLEESDQRVAELTAKLQVMRPAAEAIVAYVRAPGANLAEQLSRVLGRVHDVTSHGVRRGAASALAIAYRRSRVDLRGYIELPEGERLGDLEHLVRQYEGAADAVVEVMTAEEVIHGAP